MKGIYCLICELRIWSTDKIGRGNLRSGYLCIKCCPPQKEGAPYYG